MLMIGYGSSYSSPYVSNSYYTPTYPYGGTGMLLLTMTHFIKQLPPSLSPSLSLSLPLSLSPSLSLSLPLSPPSLSLSFSGYGNMYSGYGGYRPYGMYGAAGTNTYGMYSNNEESAVMRRAEVRERERRKGTVILFNRKGLGPLSNQLNQWWVPLLL